MFLKLLTVDIAAALVFGVQPSLVGAGKYTIIMPRV